MTKQKTYSKLKSHDCKRCGNKFIAVSGGNCYSCNVEIAKEKRRKIKNGA